MKLESKVRIWTISSLLLAATLNLSIARAQAVFDGTTGGQVAGSTASSTIDVSQGSRAGNNVFHSFSSFSIPAGQTVTFTDATPTTPVQNIINRITGTSTTEINGTLASTVSGADFYLINPNGIVMGPGSSVDVPASFHISTAGELRFENGGIMLASAGSSTFSSAMPTAFGFSAAPTGSISLNGTTIVAEPGANVSISGRNITFSDPTPFDSANRIENSQGYIAFTAVNGTGEVPTTAQYVAPTITGFGEISAFGPVGSLSDPLYDWVHKIISMETKGVVLRGQHVALTSFLVSAGSNTSAVEICLSADERLAIDSSTIGAGSALGISLSAHQVDLSRTSLSLQNGQTLINGDRIAFFLSSVTSIADELSASGDITIQATTSIDLLGEGEGDLAIGSALFAFADTANSITDPTSDGGSIRLISGGTIRLDNHSLVTTNTFDDDLGSGNIEVSALNIELLGTSRLETDSISAANAGDIRVEAETLHIDGFDELNGPSSIRADSQQASFGATGNAGSVFLDIGALTIQNGGQISAVAEGSGNAGRIVICCGTSVSVNGANSLIIAGTAPGSSGAGGKIFLSADSVTLSNGGRMNVATEGSGAAGEINVRTGTFSAVDLNRVPGSPDSAASGLGTLSGASGVPGGGGGRIAIEAGTFLLQDGAVVTTDTSGAAPAGTIDIRASELVVSGADTKLVSRAVGSSGGDAGNITLGAFNITFKDGATLSTFSESGAGGNIKLDWNRITTISGSSVTTEVRAGNSDAGNIFFAVEALPDLGFEDDFIALCGQLLDIYNDLPRYDPNFEGPRTLVLGPGNNISCANSGGGLACRPPTPPDVVCIGRDCNAIDTSSATYPPNPNTRFAVFTPASVIIVPERNVTTRCEGARQGSALVDSWSGRGQVSIDAAMLSPAGLPNPSELVTALADRLCSL